MYSNVALNRVLFLVLVAGMALSYNSASAKSIRQIYDQAVKDSKAGNYDEAIAGFDKVKRAAHELSPEACYYKGFVLFKQKKVEQAKKELDYVIEISSDPMLDQRAENLIEKIIKQGRSGGSKKSQPKNSVQVLIAAQYDSNILFSPDGQSDQGTATEQDGGRTLLVANGRRQILKDQAKSLDAKLGLVFMKSLKGTFNRADPLLLNAGIGYQRPGQLFGKKINTNYDLKFETLFLDANSDASRENILTSGVFDYKMSRSNSKTWSSDYKFQFRSDNSSLPSPAADDSSALKYELSTRQTFKLSKKRQQSYTVGLGAILNDADGDNQKYQRYNLNLSHSSSLPWWKLSSVQSLAYYYRDFNKRNDKRNDKNLSATISLLRPINKMFTGLLILNYTDNSSNVAANKYDKYSVLLGVNAGFGF